MDSYFTPWSRDHLLCNLLPNLICLSSTFTIMWFYTIGNFLKGASKYALGRIWTKDFCLGLIAWPVTFNHLAIWPHLIVNNGFILSCYSTTTSSFMEDLF